ncbi:MAG: VRR-NUC domain-containing protein [Bacteroidales bacterium]|jgi:Holliday junction resolvase|nr:VRR-NUC domain-containing protein [Bacteroidales bacterium]
MKEKGIEKTIKEYLTSIGAYWIKIHGSSYTPSGIPDIIVCWKGKFFGIEVKRTGALNEQSEKQRIHERNIRKAGGVYILVDTLEDVKKEIYNE